MKWFKRYAIGFLIALFVFTWADSSRDGFKNARLGGVLIMATFWPISAAVVLGGTVAEIMQGRA